MLTVDFRLPLATVLTTPVLLGAWVRHCGHRHFLERPASVTGAKLRLGVELDP